MPNALIAIVCSLTAVLSALNLFILGIIFKRIDRLENFMLFDKNNFNREEERR